MVWWLKVPGKVKIVRCAVSVGFTPVSNIPIKLKSVASGQMTLRCWQEYIPWSIGRTQQSSVLSKPDPLQLSSPQTRPEVLDEYLTCINFIPFSQLQQSSSWGCFIFKVNRQKIFQTNVDRGVVDTPGFGQIQNTIGCGEVCLHHWLWKCADLTTVKTCVHCSCIDPTV